MSLKLAPRPDERLTALERLEVLCDPGSISLIRTDVRSRRMGEKARAGDGVLGGSGRVDGRPIFCFAQDASFVGGSLGQAHADTVVQVLQRAGRAEVPVIGFIESGGARMQEGLAALGGYGRIFREHVALSGRVPQISVICGPSAGGGSYAPALTDFVIMTAKRRACSSPVRAVVKQVMGEDVDGADARGPEGSRAQRRLPPRGADRGRCRAAGTRPAGPSAAVERRAAAAVAGRRGADLPARRLRARARIAASTTCARSPGRSSTADGCWRSRRSTRATSSARSRASTAARSASSPTSRAISAACSTVTRR